MIYLFVYFYLEIKYIYINSRLRNALWWNPLDQKEQIEKLDLLFSMFDYVYNKTNNTKIRCDQFN